MLHPEHVFQNLPQHLTMQEIRNPYLVIEDFFSNNSLPEVRHDLDKWFRSAFAQKSRLGKKDSLSLLSTLQHLVRLLEAGQLLLDDPANEEKVLPLTADDAILMNTALFYQPCPYALAWECFPRHLSRPEYANPYLVFAKCLGQLHLSGWRKFLKDLFYAATYDTQINEAVNDDDIYYTCKSLFKLVEACHLIRVREIDPGVSPGPAAHGPASPTISNKEMQPNDTEIKAA